MKEDYPEVGEFLIRVTVAAEIQAGQGFPFLEVSLGYRPDTELLMREFELIELTTTAEQTVDNKRTYPDELALATIVIRRVEFVGPIFEQWPPETHRRILFESPLRGNSETAYSEEVLRRFMSRAYRRPVRPEELQSIMEFLATVRPEFLYLVEPGDDVLPVEHNAGSGTAGSGGRRHIK
jgi:hypothetical protein